MNLRSGLTYIIVNRKTRLVLDDPVQEGGSVIVNHLNKEDTQKWMVYQGRDGLWTLRNVRNGRFLCVETLHTKDGDPVIAKHCGSQNMYLEFQPGSFIGHKHRSGFHAGSAEEQSG